MKFQIKRKHISFEGEPKLTNTRKLVFKSPVTTTTMIEKDPTQKEETSSY